MAQNQDIKQSVVKQNKGRKPVAGVKPGRSKSERNRVIFYILSLVILTIVVFSNCLDNYFITNLDDNLYISCIQNLKNMTSADINAMFTTFMAGNYHPLAILSLTLDLYFHGMNAYPFHLINLIFHTANVVLVFLFIYLFLRRIEAALIVALFFAIHPMHVESVSWIAERKDVLYTFFFVLSLICYTVFLNNDGKYKYFILSIVFFVLSLLSKPAAVCLAPVIVLMDYYRKRKFNMRVIFEKVPFFILSLTFGILSVFSQKSGDALNNLSPVFSLLDRVFLISFSTMFYIVKAIFPVNLQAFYYYPEEMHGNLPLTYYLAPLGIAMIVFLVIKFKKIRQDLIFGFIFYFFTIALVLQFLPVGFAIVAERYSYVPYIGLFFIVAKLYCDFIDNRFGNYNKTRRNYLISLIAVVALIFAYGSHERNKVWSDGVVLFNDIIEKSPESGHAYFARGNGKYDKNQFREAKEDFEEAIKHNYKYPVIYNNRANCFYQLGQIPEAIRGYSEAIKIDSTYGMSFFDRATAKQKLNDMKGSIEDYKKAIKYNFNLSWSYNGIGYSLLSLKDYDGALENFNQAIKLQTDYAAAYHNRAVVEYSKKNYQAALKDYDNAVKYDSKYTIAYYNRGLVKIALNDRDGACSDFTKASQLNYPQADAALKQYCSAMQGVKF